ncbi:hypothetical protein V7O62_08095 [Methanolobus sp. ZRKC2]|uniref:DUF7289 family protein n=1 Tax=Methanolobus sp. ZRKC2 TaxID=3125783 RepID=UPI003249B637
MEKSFKYSNDAVSEIVDYSIILAIILFATGIIIVAGVPILEDMQDAHHTENIKQSFQVLALNINKVVFGNAPTQSVELKMYGGSLSVTGNSQIGITMQTWNSSSDSFSSSFYGKQMRKIENDFQDTSTGYENTGVWIKYSTGEAIMASEPRFTYANNVLVIPDGSVSGADSISGSGLVRVTTDAGTRSINSYQNVSHVNISITSDYFKAWEKYLNESMEMQIVDVDAANNTFTASKNYNPNIDVYIVNSAMDVRID